MHKRRRCIVDKLWITFNQVAVPGAAQGGNPVVWRGILSFSPGTPPGCHNVCYRCQTPFCTATHSGGIQPASANSFRALPKSFDEGRRACQWVRGLCSDTAETIPGVGLFRCVIAKTKKICERIGKNAVWKDALGNEVLSCREGKNSRCNPYPSFLPAPVFLPFASRPNSH